MNNIILRSREFEYIFEGPNEEFELTKLLPRFDGVEQIKNKFKKLDHIDKNAINIYVVELIDNTRTLTVFKRTRWNNDNSLNWKRCHHMIWTINS